MSSRRDFLSSTTALAVPMLAMPSFQFEISDGVLLNGQGRLAAVAYVHRFLAPIKNTASTDRLVELLASRL